MRLPWRRRGDVSCPQCGAAAPGDARWCGTCGAALTPEPDPAADDDTADSGAAPGPGRFVAAGLMVVLLGGLLVVQAVDEPPVVPAGFMSRGDGARSGVVSHTTVPAPSGVAWRVPVSVPPLLTPGADVLGTTTAADGRELVVVHDPAADGQRVTSHDAQNGEVVATTMLPLGSQPYDISLAGGLLAHRDLASVTLVDLTTGAHLWRVEERLREDTQLSTTGVVGVPAQSDGAAVTLLGLDDGATVWTTAVAPAGLVTTVLGLEDAVVVEVEGDDVADLLVGLDPVTGEVLWRHRGGAGGLPPRGGEFPEVPLTTDGQHVLVVGDGEVVLINGADGAVRSIVPGPEDSDAPLSSLVASAASVAGVGDGLVVLSDAVQRIVGVDVTGDVPVVRWEVPAPGAPVFTLAVTGDRVVVRGDAGTTLLDAATGNPVASVGPAGGTARLVVTEDGSVARLTADAVLELVGEGGRRWQGPTSAVHLPDLATDAGTAAVTTPDGVEVFEVGDGLRRFAHEAFEPRLVDADSLTPPVLLGGRVSIAPPETQPPDRGGLLSLFADTGIIDWARTVDRVVPRGVVAVDRDLLVVPVGSQLLGFDRASGRRALVVETTIARSDVAAADGWLVAVDGPRDRGDLWVGRRSTRELVFRAPIRTCAPPVLHEDVVIVVNHLGDIVARELETGEQPWGEKAQGSACRPLSLAEEVLVALVDDRELLAVSLDEGDTVWRVELPAVAAGAPVVAGDQVLVPTLAGEVVAYDVRGTEDPGAPAWRVAVDGTPAGSVAVDGDTILVITRSGELVALR